MSEVNLSRIKGDIVQNPGDGQNRERPVWSGDVHQQANNPFNRQGLQMKTERFRGMV